MRKMIIVAVDTDQVPGWGYDPQDFVELIQRQLDNSVGHYNPEVRLATEEESAHLSKT
jgi:hypothetical protein